MEVRIRSDSVEIEGYVNAVERASKPLFSRIGRFIEKICKGAFQRAIDQNNDVLMYLNHDPSKVLARTSDKTLELYEDSIGLHARAVVTDPEVMQMARNGDLVGWSFGFYDKEVEDLTDSETGLPLRKVRDLDLREVSIINRQKSPAYDGTLVCVRDDEAPLNSGEIMPDVRFIEEDEEDEEDDLNDRSEQETEPVEIDYSKYEALIAEMKEAK
jgi:HK97 family phage prohead protease